MGMPIDPAMPADDRAKMTALGIDPDAPEQPPEGEVPPEEQPPEQENEYDRSLTVKGKKK
jgi:hypothetical protein